MSDKKIKQRKEIDEKYRWSIEKMYKTEGVWDRDFKTVSDLSEEYSEYKGRLSESSETLLAALDAKYDIWRTFEHLYVFAKMKMDEDNRNTRYQAMSSKAQKLGSKVAEAMSFVNPELQEIPADTLNKFLFNEQGLHVYTHMLKNLIRQKEHILSLEAESLLAQFGEVASAPSYIFRMINNADIKFGNMKDEDGDEIELTHGNYITMMESEDRSVREAAYRKLYGAYMKQKNTISTTYNYNVKTHALFAKIRKYKSSLSAELSEDNIPPEVYTNLIETVNSRLDLIHRYVEIRRKLLKLDKVHMYDMYVPLISMPDLKMSYEACVELVKKALAPLGEEYGKALEKGFSQWGWVDVFENEGKTSGAYSFGSYDSHPFVLLNFSGKKKDAFTIAHEMGHSMNSYYTRMYQPFIYGGHSIFTAEVASTVNEILLMKYMMKNSESDKERSYLLNLHIEEFRSTFFRQTMFAEFEKMTHEAVESGEVLTREWLCENYGKLNRKYFGEEVEYDEEITMEWARIPHFYNDFYVYKYATGYSAAIQIAERIWNEGEPAVQDYLKFLQAGDSDYPIELLKIAGVDMSKKEPIENAISVFESLIDEMEKLVK